MTIDERIEGRDLTEENNYTHEQVYAERAEAEFKREWNTRAALQPEPAGVWVSRELLGKILYGPYGRNEVREIEKLYEQATAQQESNHE